MRVLLVDDDPLVRQTIERMLAETVTGFDAVTNGREAMGRVSAGSHDAIVVDIMMPEMDVIETIRAIRSIDPDVRIVAITGTPVVRTSAGGVDYLTFARTFGADAVLRKPFRRADLLAAVGGGD